MYKLIKLERMSMIKLDSHNYNLYFNVYCVYIITFNKLAKKVKEKKLFSNLIQTFEDNKEVYPFQYNDISFNPNNFEEFQHEYNYLNQYCSMKVINYIKLKRSIVNSKSGILSNTYLTQIKENQSYQILFIEIIQDDIP